MFNQNGPCAEVKSELDKIKKELEQARKELKRKEAIIKKAADLCQRLFEDSESDIASRNVPQRGYEYIRATGDTAQKIAVVLERPLTVGGKLRFRAFRRF